MLVEQHLTSLAASGERESALTGCLFAADAHVQLPHAVHHVTTPTDVPAPSVGRVLAATRVLKAYVALTKPRIIELLLITTLPTMVLAADGWPGAVAHGRDADRRHPVCRFRQRIQQLS